MKQKMTLPPVDRLSKKTPQADIEQRRTTGFLLGMAFVLSLLYVVLEWNSMPDDTPFEALDFDEMVHESELVPMSDVETVAQLSEQRQKPEKAERLHVVDDDVALEQHDPTEAVSQEGIDDESLLQQLDESLADDKALAPMGVDPNNPLNFHVAEDLPQFPGGAVEFMKWLTKHLRYPASARSRNIQGKVVAVFYVEKDGHITGINITRSLSAECDREALRVLRMMPNWTPGIQNDQPCRTKVCIPIVFKL